MGASRQCDRESVQEYYKERLLARNVKKIKKTGEVYSKQRKIRRIRLWFLVD